MEGSSRSAAELITRLVNGFGGDDGGVVSLVTQWPSIVGTDFAAHSTVSDIRGTALVVTVDHPAWLHQMHFSREDLLARVRRAVPDLTLTSLYFLVGNSTPGTRAADSPERARQRERRAAQKAPEPLETNQPTSQAIDPELAARLARLRKTAEDHWSGQARSEQD